MFSFVVEIDVFCFTGEIEVLSFTAEKEVFCFTAEIEELCFTCEIEVFCFTGGRSIQFKCGWSAFINIILLFLWFEEQIGNSVFTSLWIDRQHCVTSVLVI